MENSQERPKGFLNYFCHPLGNGHRFVALFFMCFLSFGYCFCYDSPAALQDYLKRDLKMSELQYTSLYSVYSWPNVILNFLGGFLIDRFFGVRLGANIYIGLTLFGHLIFAFAVFFNVYWLMLVGRFLFGIGAESLYIAQSNYVVLWFKDKELNMAFGLELSIARLGSTVNFLVMESLYKSVHNKMHDKKRHYILGVVFIIAGAVCLSSFICSIVLGILDKRAETILGRNINPTGETVKLSDIKNFKPSFWLVTLICVTFYCALFPFITIAKDFFQTEFNMNAEDSNFLSSIIYIISGVASPFLGYGMDKIGMHILWIFIGTFGILLSHILLGFTTLTPYVAIVLMGITYTIFGASLWPLISFIIPEYQLGTAYGVTISIQNLGLGLIPIFTGLIVGKYSYTAVEILFISTSGVAIICNFILWLIDRTGDNYLNMSAARRRRLKL